MKRLQRKVRNSTDETTLSPAENVSGTFTFDRRTFFECSNRMKRIVPTLGRGQHSNSMPLIMIQPTQDKDLRGACEMSEEASSITTDDDALGEKESASVAAATNTLKMSDLTSEVFSEDATDYGTGTPQSEVQPSSTGFLFEKETRSKVELDDNGIEIISSATLTLPKAKVPTTSGIENMSSSTLPASLTPPKSRSRRQLWLKPLTNFVAFMSHIGDNVHITSYPQQ